MTFCQTNKEGGIPAKVSLSSTNASKRGNGPEKKKKKKSGKEKLKISSYASVFGKNLQKRVHSILTKLADGRQIQNLTFSAL